MNRNRSDSLAAGGLNWDSLPLKLFAGGNAKFWDPAEIEPPALDALAPLSDAESGARRTLWLRPKLRSRWRDAVARRRTELDGLFAVRAIRPFYVVGAFDADAMSQYFLEASA